MYACYAMASMLSDQGMAILLLIGRTSGGGTEVLLLLHACSTPVVSAVTGKSWQLRDQLIRMMVTWDRDCSSVLLGWVAAGSGATMLYVMMVCCLAFGQLGFTIPLPLVYVRCAYVHGM